MVEDSQIPVPAPTVMPLINAPTHSITLTSTFLSIFKSHPFFILATFLALIILGASLFVKTGYLFFNTMGYFDEPKLERHSTKDRSTGEPVNDEDELIPRGLIHPSVDKYLRETDIAGLFSGIIGIAIGLYLAVIVNKQDQLQVFATKSELERLKNQNTDLILATNSIKSSNVEFRALLEQVRNIHTKLLTVIGYENILTEIHDIYTNAHDNCNDLYILNLSADFGYYLLFNAETVVRKLNYKNVQDVTTEQYVSAFRELERLQHALNPKLIRNKIDLVKRERGDVKFTYVTLPIAESGSNPTYENEYLDKILQGMHFETFGQFGNDKLENPLGLPASNICLIPEDGLTPRHREDLSKYFREKLVKKQEKDMAEMQKFGIDVFETSNIPVQLFISFRPDNPNGGKCLFMFVNQQTIGKNEITGFTSTDDNIIQHFVNLYISALGEALPKRNQPS